MNLDLDSLLHVFSFLNLEDLKNVRLINKDFSSLVTVEYLFNLMNISDIMKIFNVSHIKYFEYWIDKHDTMRKIIINIPDATQRFDILIKKFGVNEVLKTQFKPFNIDEYIFLYDYFKEFDKNLPYFYYITYDKNKIQWYLDNHGFYYLEEIFFLSTNHINFFIENSDKIKIGKKQINVLSLKNRLNSYTDVYKFCKKYGINMNLTIHDSILIIFCLVFFKALLMFILNLLF